MENPAQFCDVGGMTPEELTAQLEAQEVQLNEFARTLLAHPLLARAETERIELVERTPAQLGLPDGATLPEFLEAARRAGLAPCPPETGPYLRLARLDQSQSQDMVLSSGRAPDGSLHVLSEPLSEDHEYPKGFYLRVVDGVRWLRGYRCDDEYIWPADSVMVLRRP